MTKVIILGQEENKQTKKPIEFVKYFSSNYNIFDKIDLAIEPNKFRTIELITKDYTKDNLDLMFAYDDDRYDIENAMLFLGKFNDGFVE